MHGLGGRKHHPFFVLESPLPHRVGVHSSGILFRNRPPAPAAPCALACRYFLHQAADGKKGGKRLLSAEEEAKKKKRMERFGIVDEKAEAAKRKQEEVSRPGGLCR